MPRSLLYTGILSGLVLRRSCAYCHYCEFVSAPILSGWWNRSPCSHILHLPLTFYLLFHSDPWTLWVRGMMQMVHSGWEVHSLFFVPWPVLDLSVNRCILPKETSLIFERWMNQCSFVKNKEFSDWWHAVGEIKWVN